MRDFLAFSLVFTLFLLGIFIFLNIYSKKGNVLKIVSTPHPILRSVAAPIPAIDQSVTLLAKDMVATLRHRALVDFFTSGSMPRGLAAPQVGVPKRLVVCGLKGEIKVMVNPEILKKKGTFTDRDGCLSIEGDSGRSVYRAAYISLRYSDLAGMEKNLVATGRDAALLEHEIDHLNGILKTDYQ